MLRVTEERAVTEHGVDSEEVDKLLSSYADLFDECPALFAEVGDLEQKCGARVYLSANPESSYIDVLLSVHARLSS